MDIRQRPQKNAEEPADGSPVLRVQDLNVTFSTDVGEAKAVDGVTFDVQAGEILGVVGESGSGKSVTVGAVMALLDPATARVDGHVLFEGIDMVHATNRQLRQVRGLRIGMIFQDPMTALNPVRTVGSQIGEAIRIHHSDVSRRGARARAVELLTSVGIPQPERRVDQYPHEYSGGMRQRAVIAMAIANNPTLLIADEPTTALDVTIQAQILDMIRQAQQDTKAATIFITHDLGVVAELAERVIVMYAGRIMEEGTVGTLFRRPRHPYTLGLLASLPKLSGPDAPLQPIPGSPPNILVKTPGCPFQPRCTLGSDRDICRTERPELRTIGEAHRSACHFAEELGEEMILAEPEVISGGGAHVR